MIVRCKTCIMPNSRPDTPFIDGECQACLNYRHRPQIDWEQRRTELISLLDRHDGRVIVPSSGGKDSTYQAIMLKQLGADVTAVTARTCHLTPIGRSNIDNLAKHVRTIEVVPKMEVRATLNRLGLRLVGDISWPEHAAIFSTPFRVARDMGINLIMFGENPQNQYGGPIGTEQAKQMTHRWITEFGGFLGLRPADLIGQEGITARDMADYEPIPASKAAGIEAHFLGAYLPWDSHQNYTIAKHHGFCALCDRLTAPYPGAYWPFENLDNAQTAIHDYGMYLKYGYNRCCTQLSVDIRAGKISREQALQISDQKRALEPAHGVGISIAIIADRIGMTKDGIYNALNQFKSAGSYHAG